MLSPALEQTLNSAIQNARDQRHEYVTVEHLLQALLENPEAADVLVACGGELDELRQDLEGFLAENVPLLVEDSDADTQPTLGFQRVIQRAILHVRSSGKDEVDGANVLVAVFSEHDSHAVFFLHKQDISRFDVISFISHGVGKASEGEGLGLPAPEPDSDAEKRAAPDALEAFTVNLNAQAAAGRIDPLIGRGAELERTIQILCRRRKNNPLFVGEAGVGKTALAEGLAKRIVDEEVPEIMSDCVIYSLDMGSLLAGTKYRGDFEQRLKGVLRALTERNNAALFIDEIHTVIGAGAASGGTMDASNLLKPVLQSGELRFIGSTTYQEYRGIFEKDAALSRRFQKIDVEEPSVEEAVEILNGLRERFEEHHGIRYTEEALRSAAVLADRYINERHLPDKAIDVIDEAAARTHLDPPGERKRVVDVEQIESVVARMARIPPRKVSVSDRESLKHLERDLGLAVFGQEEAIGALAAAIKMARSGLGRPDKPIGAYLFSGPTGVGKTEVSRQLAFVLGIELLRFDMSEYMERHTVSRLIGAPPGYVGFDQGGLLTEQVSKHPHAVLLLDEIEKAHPDVFNLLLQVMDHGTLTDNNGRKTDFRNVILIMTTNAGAERMSRSSMGFTSQDHSGDDLQAIQKMFSPEFRNRLDAIIPFRSLDKKTIKQVVDKFLVQVEGQLEAKGVSLTVDDKARDWLADKGYDPSMGARPMERLIQDRIKKALAEELLFGKLEHGGAVHISAGDEDLEVEITPGEPAPARPDEVEA
ncbi:MAG: ATP-dependent Clp protease ATP-binding subunit ClpA [Gammaproteobacteria bacterium]|nr:ATP-dependent Clp protease ATP-binding subunit ClpA [Gammaproteobacteria bacterium]